MDELDLWLKYPLIVKCIKNTMTVYQGTISVNEEDYQISISIGKDNAFKLALPSKLAVYDNEVSSAIRNLNQKTIVAVLDTLVKTITSKIPHSIPINHSDMYKHILYEYSEFTKFYLNLKFCSLAPDLSKIDFSIVDEQNREHSAVIAINFDDKTNIFKIISSDLPEGRELFKESPSLKVMYDQFFKVVDTLQPFFNIMDVYDKNCWILDPLAPKRNMVYRRIYLGENLSVVITVDPYNIAGIPDMKFLGPERLVNIYRERINENLTNWMYENDVYTEVLKLLGMDSFPQKIMSQERVPDVLKESGDCSICFSLRLNEKLPEVVCKNKYCENYYHTECLYEWLISVNARRSFNQIVGQCPNCEKNISCPIPV